jgi:hypothetical protein
MNLEKCLRKNALSGQLAVYQGHYIVFRAMLLNNIKAKTMAQINQ